MPLLRDEELIERVSKSLRSFNFFIFQRTLYPKLVSLLKSADMVKLVRISELNGNKTYYVLEPDHIICSNKCSSKCLPEGDFKCYAECMYTCISSLIEVIVSNLNSIYKNPS